MDDFELGSHKLQYRLRDDYTRECIRMWLGMSNALILTAWGTSEEH